jgi:ABC-type Fe3+-hydroxamate transport system substrate-binding protein
LSTRSQLSYRLLFLGLLVLGATFWGGRYLAQKSAPEGGGAPPAADEAETLVSLSPGVTETIVALGAGQALVGISDYCTPPAGVSPSRVGTAITPRYEAIARLAPTLILTSEVRGEQLSPLSRLASTHSLPWLTLEEWSDSVLVLGRLIHRTEPAKQLHDKILSTLAVNPPADAPRILLALDYGDSGSNQIWYIRKDSIHGAALEAAGAKNAVTAPVHGTPHLTPEELLNVDPDGILLLRGATDPQSDHEARTSLARFTPLRAVKENRLGVVNMEGSMTVGPSVLQLVPLLRSKIKEIMLR